MAQVGVARLLHRVVIDVDDVVEHAHRRGRGCLDLGVVHCQHTISADDEVLGQIHAAQVAHRDLMVIGVQRDLGAQVG
jgi:hypothetical protein